MSDADIERRRKLQVLMVRVFAVRLSQLADALQDGSARIDDFFFSADGDGKEMLSIRYGFASEIARNEYLKMLMEAVNRGW